MTTQSPNSSVDVAYERRTQSCEAKKWPIVARADFALPSVFTPENLLREARRQKSLAPSAVPG